MLREAEIRFVVPGYEPHERRLRVLRMRACGLSFEEIGRRLGGVTPVRARQLYVAAVRLRRRQREIDHAWLAAADVAVWCERHPKRTLSALLAVDFLARRVSL